MNYMLFYIGMDLVPGALGAVIVGSHRLFCGCSCRHAREDKLYGAKVITIIFGISE
jgi:hypothetical protein